MEWKDVTFVGVGGETRELKGKALRLIVARDDGTWWLRCERLGIGRLDLGTDDLDTAKRLALRYAQERADAMAEDLRRLRGAPPELAIERIADTLDRIERRGRPRRVPR